MKTSSVKTYHLHEPHDMMHSEKTQHPSCGTMAKKHNHSPITKNIRQTKVENLKNNLPTLQKCQDSERQGKAEETLKDCRKLRRNNTYATLDLG